MRTHVITLYLLFGAIGQCLHHPYGNGINRHEQNSAAAPKGPLVEGASGGLNSRNLPPGELGAVTCTELRTRERLVPTDETTPGVMEVGASRSRERSSLVSDAPFQGLTLPPRPIERLGDGATVSTRLIKNILRWI